MRGLRDVHCHILPGVDDGARDMDESLRMLEAARRAGVTGIVCTPHCRDPYFDYDAMRGAFRALRERSGGFPLQMGFEVNHRKLMELGMDWVDRLAFEGGREFLLELSSRADEYEFQAYERTVYLLQARGLTVYIAHPERCRAIQRDPELARRLVRMGCVLVASADFVRRGRLRGAGRAARRMLHEGLCSRIASDAHRPAGYALLSRAAKSFPMEGVRSGR